MTYRVIVDGVERDATWEEALEIDARVDEPAPPTARPSWSGGRPTRRGPAC